MIVEPCFALLLLCEVEDHRDHDQCQRAADPDRDSARSRGEQPPPVDQAEQVADQRDQQHHRDQACCRADQHAHAAQRHQPSGNRDEGFPLVADDHRGEQRHNGNRHRHFLTAPHAKGRGDHDHGAHQQDTRSPQVKPVADRRQDHHDAEQQHQHAAASLRQTADPAYHRGRRAVGLVFAGRFFLD